jgi:hypothetical protein
LHDSTKKLSRKTQCFPLDYCEISYKISLVAGAAWWSMASHLAAQDYLARLQATGLNFPSLGSPADLQYASLGLPPHSSSHHKSSKNSKGASSTSLSKSKDNKLPSPSPLPKLDGRLDHPTVKANSSMSNSKSSGKYSSSSGVSGLTIQPSMKLPNSSEKKTKVNDINYLKPMDKKTTASVSSSVKVSSSSSPSIFTSPLSLASNYDKSVANTLSTQSSSDSISGSSLPSSSILR